MTLPIYGLDIETDTSISPTSGLDPFQGSITSVALVGGSSEQVLMRDPSGEVALLTGLDALLAELEPGIIATWNGAVFDLPFITTRAELIGVPLALEVQADPGIHVKYEPTPGHAGGYRARWGHHLHVDVQFLYQELAAQRGLKWSLKPVSRSLGLEPIEVDRERMHLLTPEEERAYVASDSRVTRELAIIADCLGALHPDALV